MYVIAVYDVAAERTAKLHKVCKRYLHWIQNSTFEGELSELQLRKLRDECREQMDESHDSLILFKSRNSKWLEKDIYGQERNDTGQFL